VSAPSSSIASIPPTDAIYKIEVAHWPGQEMLEEPDTTPPVDFIEDEDDEFGARTLRAHLRRGGADL
jgi:hypothetical protein